METVSTPAILLELAQLLHRISRNRPVVVRYCQHTLDAEYEGDDHAFTGLDATKQELFADAAQRSIVLGLDSNTVFDLPLTQHYRFLSHFAECAAATCGLVVQASGVAFERHEAAASFKKRHLLRNSRLEHQNAGFHAAGDDATLLT